MRCLPIALLLFVACASDPEAPRGDPAERKAAAVRYEQQRCDDGNQKACAELGLRYARGDGVPLDPDRATKLLQGACDAKVARGCGTLAGRLIAEAPTQAETARAAIYARAYDLADRACAGGDGVGCHHLATLYDSGLGTNRAPARALALYTQACNAKVAPSCVAAASLHERGAAGAIDERQALTLYHQACVAELPAACAAEARLDLATRSDVARGLALADAACKQNNALGCAALALAQTPVLVPPIEQACTQGYRSFCLELVTLMRAGQAAGDELRQRSLLRLACDAGWKRGCDELARLAAPQP